MNRIHLYWIWFAIFTLGIFTHKYYDMSRDVNYYKEALTSRYVINLENEVNKDLYNLNVYNQLVQKYPKDKDINTQFQSLLFRTYFHCLTLGKELDVNKEKTEYEIKDKVEVKING